MWGLVVDPGHDAGCAPAERILRSGVRGAAGGQGGDVLRGVVRGAPDLIQRASGALCAMVGGQSLRSEYENNRSTRPTRVRGAAGQCYCFTSTARGPCVCRHTGGGRFGGEDVAGRVAAAGAAAAAEQSSSRQLGLLATSIRIQPYLL